MTAICITGLHRETLQAAARLLHEAGMATACAPERGGSMDIHAWHAQVVSRAGRDPASLQAPGRLWEQLAADILVANLASPCWGWAEPLSVPLLGFWRAFESQMRFVLVCETLEDVIARHIEDEQPTEALEAAIGQWHEGHEAMLRFHLRNSQVSEMVWGHTMGTSGARLMKTWSAQWSLPLAAGQDIGAPVAPTSSLGAGNPLIAFLAQRILREHPATQALAEELAASIPAFGDDALAVAELNPSVSALVAGMRALRANAGMQAALAEAEQAKVKLDEHMLQQAKLQQDLDALREAKDALQAERDKVAKDRERSESAKRDADTEIELLLQQLHQVQEELQRHFLDNQSKQLQVEQLQARCTRVMGQVSGAVDCESLELVSVGNDTAGCRWVAKGVIAAGHRLDALEFETVIDHGVLGIQLRRQTGKPEPLLRWPLSDHRETQVRLIPFGVEKDEGKHLARLAQLSSSDWDISNALVNQIVRMLAGGKTGLPPANQLAVLQAAARTRSLMRPLLDLFRFDNCNLMGQQASETREVLGLQMTHLSWRGQRSAEFDFQFQAKPSLLSSNANSADTAYLIFSRASATALFEAWTFNAKGSDSQPVMAIPFSARGPMAEIWGSLTQRDRAFVTGLIDVLPVGLAHLYAQKEKLARSWKDWIQLATKLRQWARQAPTGSLESVVPHTAQTDGPPPAKRKRKSPAQLETKSVPKTSRTPRSRTETKSARGQAVRRGKASQ
jgi:hypothetical protein